MSDTQEQPSSAMMQREAFKRILSWLPLDSAAQASVLKHFSSKGQQFSAIRAFLNINPIPLPGSPELKLYMETDDFKGHQISNMWSFIMAQRATTSTIKDTYFWVMTQDESFAFDDDESF